MLKATFTKPPCDQRNATLYQHALATLRVAREANEAMKALDNRDSVDVNSNVGTIVTAHPVDVNIQPELAGSLTKQTYHSMHGQLADGRLVATLKTRDDESARVTFSETDTQTSAALETRCGNGYRFTPGTLRVLEDKATGALTVEQEQDWPWTFHIGPGVPEREARFEASGPNSTSDVRFYQQGVSLEKAIRSEITSIQKLDNAKGDLNPAPGLVVLAGYKPVESDNLVYSHMAGNYHVPTEVCVEFDPNSGAVSRYTRGFGENVMVGYQREAGKEVFETNQFLNFNRVEVNSDGSRLHQEFQSTYAPELAEKFKEESRVETGLLPRVLNWSGVLGGSAAGAAAGLIGGLVFTGPVGLALGAVALGVTLAMNTNPIRVSTGINRFEGKDPATRMARAEKAFNAERSFGGGTGQVIRFTEPADREACRKFILGAHSNYGSVLILSDKFGESGEPAVLKAPLGLGAPLRVTDTGVELPGGQVVRYESIRAMKNTGGH